MEICLDGYYCDPHGDMSFAHKSPDNADWQGFVTGNTSGGGMPLFRRSTADYAPNDRTGVATTIATVA